MASAEEICQRHVVVSHLGASSIISPCPLRPDLRRLAVTRQHDVNTLKENVMRCGDSASIRRTQRVYHYEKPAMGV